MNYQNQKINFYQKRTFGENITVTFDFLKETWKPLLKLCLYVMLPFSIIQGILINNFYGSALGLAKFAPTTVQSLEGISPSVIINYVLIIFISWIGVSFLTAIVYSVMQKYQNSDPSEEYSLSDVKPDLISYIKQCLILTFFLVILGTGYVFIAGSLSVLSPFLLIVIIPGTIALIVPLSLIYPAYIFGEESGTTVALKNSFRLGFSTWGSLFLLLLVLSLIGGIISTITSLPWSMVAVIKSILALKDPSAVTNSVGADILTYVLAVVQTFGAYVSEIFVLVGVAFHYFSVSEAKDSVSVSNDIDNFEQL